MSRHSLQPLGGSGAVYEIAIGWDRSLASYFVIVFGLPGDHDRDIGVPPLSSFFRLCGEGQAVRSSLPRMPLSKLPLPMRRSLRVWQRSLHTTAKPKPQAWLTRCAPRFW